jgi:Arc/MetJ family transcription regulator
MSRTNIDIDDELITRVMHRYRVGTKREVAAVAINNDLEVLAVGRDLETIAEHSALRLVSLTR